VSIFPAVPGQPDRAPTLDIFSKDEEELVESLRDYVKAIADGRIELTLRRGGTRGRIRILLADGRTENHLYNCVFNTLIGRSKRWETFSPERY
jgi:hypothetical protein